MNDSKNDDNPPPELAELRRRADKEVETELQSVPLERLTPTEAARLIHEIKVHQIELEMQNEDLRQSQVRLEEATHRYADLYDFAPLAYLTLDEWGRILEANLTAASFLGIERSRLLDHQFTLLLVEPDRLRFRNLLVNPLNLPERQGKFQLQDRNGRARTVLLNLRFLRDAEGRNRSRLTLTDITDLKLAQDALKKSKDKLRRLNATLEQRVQERTAELEHSNRELETFSYSVAHDLKTPIRAIQGFSRMLLEEHTTGLDNEGRRLLRVVIENAQLMDRLIDDLLNLARLVHQPMNKMSLDLAGMAKGVFERLRSQEPGRDLQLIVKESPPAWGDYPLLYQVLTNLLENAFKFTRKKETAVIVVGGAEQRPGNHFLRQGQRRRL
jgi:PAS domain S-box-containing protein